MKYSYEKIKSGIKYFVNNKLFNNEINCYTNKGFTNHTIHWDFCTEIGSIQKLVKL